VDNYDILEHGGQSSKVAEGIKLKNGLGDWGTFITDVEKKFGDNHYRDALTQLLELQQTESLDTYIAAFEELQYQISMHNSNMGDLFLATEFLKGLKMEISSVVQAQVPE
jgi:hypothetical protein